MFGISGTELFLIAAFALIIFGPDKLPKMARTVGRYMNEFKRVQNDVEMLLRAEINSADKPESTPESTLETAEVPVVEEWTSPSFGDDVDDEEGDEE